MREPDEALMSTLEKLSESVLFVRTSMKPVEFAPTVILESLIFHCFWDFVMTPLELHPNKTLFIEPDIVNVVIF